MAIEYDEKAYLSLEGVNTTPIAFEPKFSKGREEILDYISNIESESQIATELSTDGKNTAGLFHIRMTTFQDLMQSPKLREFIESVPELAAFSTKEQAPDNTENRLNFARLMAAQPALEREIAAMYTHRLDELFAKKSTRKDGVVNLPIDTQALEKNQRDALYCFAYNVGANTPNLRRSVYHYQNLPDNHPHKQKMWDEGVGNMTTDNPQGGNAKRYIGCQMLATEGIYKPMAEILEENKTSAAMIAKVKKNEAVAQAMFANFEAAVATAPRIVMQEPEFPLEATYP